MKQNVWYFNFKHFRLELLTEKNHENIQGFLTKILNKSWLQFLPNSSFVVFLRYVTTALLCFFVAFSCVFLFSFLLQASFLQLIVVITYKRYKRTKFPPTCIFRSNWEVHPGVALDTSSLLYTLPWRTGILLSHWFPPSFLRPFSGPPYSTCWSVAFRVLILGHVFSRCFN